MRKTPYPVSRMGWHKYYVNRFNKTQHPDAAILACWYMYLHLALETR